MVSRDGQEMVTDHKYTVYNGEKGLRPMLRTHKHRSRPCGAPPQRAPNHENTTRALGTFEWEGGEARWCGGPFWDARVHQVGVTTRRLRERQRTPAKRIEMVRGQILPPSPALREHKKKNHWTFVELLQTQGPTRAKEAMRAQTSELRSERRRCMKTSPRLK